MLGTRSSGSPRNARTAFSSSPPRLRSADVVGRRSSAPTTRCSICRVTPNRGDCLSVLGVAREIAALTGARLARPRRCHAGRGRRRRRRRSCRSRSRRPICARATPRGSSAASASGPSPPWMRTRLEMVGMRPISNVVDVTNYVMLERGQPLHAFDLARIAGRRIVVRRAGSRRPFVTLDGVERELLPDDLVIADGQGPVALAGVMGGADSEIRAEHHRRAARERVLHTRRRSGAPRAGSGSSVESSYRFERGVDPGGTLRRARPRRRADRASAPAAPWRAGSIDKRAPGARRAAAIRLRPARVNALLGTRPHDRRDRASAARARRDGLRQRARRRSRSCRRRTALDLSSEVDLVEEVARLSGYDAHPGVHARDRGRPARACRRTTTPRSACARRAPRPRGSNEMVRLAMIAPDDNRVFPGLPDVRRARPSRSAIRSSAESGGAPPQPAAGSPAGARRESSAAVRRWSAAFAIGRVYARDGRRLSRGPSARDRARGASGRRTAIGRRRASGELRRSEGRARAGVRARCRSSAVRWEPVEHEARVSAPGQGRADRPSAAFSAGARERSIPIVAAARGLPPESLGR